MTIHIDSESGSLFQAHWYESCVTVQLFPPASAILSSAAEFRLRRIEYSEMKGALGWRSYQSVNMSVTLELSMRLRVVECTEKVMKGPVDDDGNVQKCGPTRGRSEREGRMEIGIATLNRGLLGRAEAHRLLLPSKPWKTANKLASEGASHAQEPLLMPAVSPIPTPRKPKPAC